MNVLSMNVNLTSEYPERLAAFYREIVGVSAAPQLTSRAPLPGGVTLSIDGHSETRGDAKEPQRFLINLVIEDLAAEQARLEKVGVRFIRTAGRERWGGLISTFVDPDGNYCQLIQFQPTELPIRDADPRDTHFRDSNQCDLPLHNTGQRAASALH